MSNVGKMSKNSKYDKDGKANVVGVVLVLFSASLRRPTKLYNICNSSSDNSGALPGSYVNVKKNIINRNTSEMIRPGAGFRIQRSHWK